MQRLFNDSMKKKGEGADSYNKLTSGTPSLGKMSENFNTWGGY